MRAASPAQPRAPASALPQPQAQIVILKIHEGSFIQHANLGKSPSKFYIELRMARARELLVHTELAIADIAHVCGYDSPSHFSRFYRRHFKERPATTRKAVSSLA